MEFGSLCDHSVAVREYETAIAAVARSTAPVPHRVDSIAWTRDDYAQELAIVAVQSRQRFREQYGASRPHERRYVLKSLWNFVRDRARAREVTRGAESGNRIETRNQRAVVGDGMEPCPQLEAREYLRELVASLSGEDLELVRRLVDAGGHVPRAHDPATDGSLRTFRRTVDRLRETARGLRR